MTVKHKHSNFRHKSDFDLYGDVAKIKAALITATQDVKGRAGELLSDSYEEMKERSIEAKDNLADFTAEKPFKSLGFALLLGMAVGYFLHRK